MSGFQRIKYDIIKSEYYIEDLEGSVKTKLPLATWGLTKEIDGVCAVVVREYQSDSLEEGTQFTYYKIPLKFAVKADYENSYLVKDVQGGNDEMWQKLAKVHIRNLENGQSQEATPQENLEYTVTKSKSSKISNNELKALLISGTCLGVFRNLNLLEKMVV